MVLELDVTVFPVGTMVPVIFKVILDSTASECTFMLLTSKCNVGDSCNTKAYVIVVC